MTAPVRIAVAGALGRMGQAVIQALGARDDVVLAARFDRPDATGEGLVDLETALAAADVVVDFTTGAASAALARHCAERGGPALVIGSTGFTDAELAEVEAATARIPILRAANYSLGVNMLMGLVVQAARALAAEGYDIEITESHHRRKIDAPSGTALMLGAAAAEGRGVDLARVSQRIRDGVTGPRRTGDIGFSVVRGGGIVGDHSVIFAAEDEILTLSHSALDRGLFARGVAQAAHWLGGRPPGAYDMQDVLGLRE